MKTKQVEYNPPCSLENAHLSVGSHRSPAEGYCVLELYACVYERPWSDHDETVSPVLASFLRSWNDSLDDAPRQKLIPYIPRIKDTNDAHDERRRWMCLDWLVRECAPAFLELTAALKPHADILRCLHEIVDSQTLQVANVPLAAAGAAAWAVAEAGAAAGAAAWAAAWDVAEAGAAAWDAAWRTLDPVITRVQESAFRLLDRMCDIGKQECAA